MDSRLTDDELTELVIECYTAGFECGIESATVFAADGLLDELRAGHANLRDDYDYWLERFGVRKLGQLRPGQIAGWREWEQKRKKKNAPNPNKEAD